MNEKLICKFCNKKFKSYRSICLHLKIHKIKVKDYYDKFFKEENEGFCSNPDCNNSTNFGSLRLGYIKHCPSMRCSRTDPDVIAKEEKSYLNKYGITKKEFLIKSMKRCHNIMKDKYGTEHALQVEDIVNKMKKNNLKKYGTESIARLNNTKEKIKNTCIKKYGVNSPIQSDIAIIKSKNTKLKKYGYVNYNNREKTKNTCLEKYGVDNVSKSEIIKKKKKDTCLKHYGVTHHNKRKEYINYMLNGGAAYLNSFVTNPSKPQVELYNITKEIYPDSVLNYPVLNFNVDIAIPSLQIIIEYDGSYWHQNKEYDKKRQRKIEKQGWKFLRYIDKVPCINNLRKDIRSIL